MRIVPYESNEDVEEIQSLGIIIKAIPFENGYAPVFALIAPSDDYIITIEEASCLMDGVEIAGLKIDSIIAEMLQSKRTNLITEGDEDDEDDF